MSAIRAADIARALGGRNHGSFWLACCPAHDDATPSLSIRDGDEPDWVLVKCFAGCKTGDVIAELARRGLWPQKSPARAIAAATRGGKRPSRAEAMAAFLAEFDAGPQTGAIIAGWRAAPRQTEIQRWRDALASLPGDSVAALRSNAEGMTIARNVWNNETVAPHGSLAQTYFETMRGLVVPDRAWERTIRFGPDIYFGRPLFSRRPAIVLLARDCRTGVPHAIQRIPLNADGSAVVDPSTGRKIKMCLGPVKHAAIMLSPVSEVRAAARLHLAEGAATAIGAINLGYAPAWAAVSADGVESFPVIDIVGELILLADNDSNKPRDRSREAAEACTRRWEAAGRRVEIIRPMKPGFDFADLASKKRAAAS
jgi:putative DNA primase/helicase